MCLWFQDNNQVVNGSGLCGIKNIIILLRGLGETFYCGKFRSTSESIWILKLNKIKIRETFWLYIWYLDSYYKILKYFLFFLKEVCIYYVSEMIVTVNLIIAFKLKYKFNFWHFNIHVLWHQLFHNQQSKLQRVQHTQAFLTY